MPSKLEQLQLQFRQRLMQEKEERMIKIHTDSQQKALSKVTKYTGAYSTQPTKTTQPHQSPIKKGSPGVDRSRPLPPIHRDSSKNVGYQHYNLAEPNKAGHQQHMESFSSGESSPTNVYNDCVAKFTSFKINKSQDTLRNGYNHQNALSSNRSSPTSAPSESTTRVPPVSSRSRSVDLEHRYPAKATIQNSRTPVGNGYSKSTNSDNKQVRDAPSDAKPTSTVGSKPKQPEMHRMKSSTKVRDESFSRGASNGLVSKPPEPRKSSKPAISTVAAPRPKPKVQAKVVPAKRTPSTKPISSTRTAVSVQTTTRKPPGPGQEQCSVCGRNFNQDRIEKHRLICKKAAQKKVKVFDATKMRVKGTEAEQFVRKGMHKAAEPKQAKKSDWRKKHSDFIEAIRQAKMVQQHLAKGGKVSDLPPPPPSDTSDYVPCPHCGRKFSEGVADRHIPKCKNILSNKKNPNAPPRRR